MIVDLPRIPGHFTGFYVMGRYQSVAWFATKDEAEKECRRMNYSGGQHYTVQDGGRPRTWYVEGKEQRP